MKPDYSPGLHILSTFSCNAEGLMRMDDCKSFFDKVIAQNGLHKVGETYHAFDGAGFTAVICLTESHISIHTWPEYGLATFDVFLSNFNNDNSAKAKDIYQKTLQFFNATENNMQEVLR